MKRKISHLLKKLKHLKPSKVYSDGHISLVKEGREWEDFYRNRFSYDKFVYSTHGVNCTGSCRWKIYVKNGVITWEHQAIDYPSTGPDFPEYEPRGCPRGASFSWYVYSPLRVKYPYVRGVLLDLWRKAKEEAGGDPVKAWDIILSDPEKERAYKKKRGRGGFVRTTWDEAYELIASALIRTIKKYGPDRIAAFTPIPAMSMVSYASGARFVSLLGGTVLSFYDWYADLPPASPQVWGEQTDVPESGDWFNADYLIMWGSNVPMTRSPDAHFMTEVRYKGTKVVSVAPDYAESVKFADEWVPVRAGTDGALAQAMTHVILKEFYADKETPYFVEYAKRYTDLPFLVLLEKTEDGKYVINRFLRASDLGKEVSNAEWKLVVWDAKSDKPVLPNGTVGYRWEGSKKWNLKLEDEEGNKIDPLLTFLGKHDEIVEIKLPYFDDNTRGVLEREIPIKKIKVGDKELVVTTVLDLMFANYGVKREGLSKGYANSYEDDIPYTPKWQEKFTGVKAEQVIRIAREFAQNAADTNGRSMIIMGAGINHWYHADIIYRTILNLVMLTGSEGRNGGGWAHYVGQEKVRPFEGWATVAFARDWYLPPRIQNATTFYYFASEQYRYEDLDMEKLSSAVRDNPQYRHPADYLYLAVRLGWLPSYPQFNRNTLELAKEAEENGAKTNEEIVKYVVEQLKSGRLDFAVADPANPTNFPRVFFVWRANWLSAGGKGHEYFIKHMLGSENGGLLAEESPLKPKEVQVREPAPIGKLDLLVNLDFRMAGTALYSDVVLPAATWYEKEDLSSTDMHPFIHSFNAAIDPPWEARSDWDAFRGLAKKFSELAEKYLPGTYKDIVTAPMMHDTPGEIAQPYGVIRDWKKGEVEPIPGKTMPNIAIVERDYTKVYDRYVSLGPNVANKPFGAHGWSWSAKEEYEELKIQLGVRKEGSTKGLPDIETARQAADAILTLSSCMNGRVASKAWKSAEDKTGLPIKDVAKDHEGERFTFEDITIQPRVTVSTPIFTGNVEDYRHLEEIWEKFDEKPLVPDYKHMKSPRRFAPFTNNTELLIPFRTLTGRQHFMLDHELFKEIGEELPVYKPPLRLEPFEEHEREPETVKNAKRLKARYLTPHGKWNIHTTFFDNIRMLTLFRGGQYVWINHEDAKEAGIKDNDWIEVVNRNGVVVARAVVSHRIPRGTAFMYHAQDRTVNVPISQTTKQVGGSHNAPTKIHIKPTHAVGAYAQLAYGFNYYGPTGTQRDEMVYIRKLEKAEFPKVEV
ncbi:MAG: nitrate reductase subunit alpha [Aquificae bacterium]|jgi:nitrate reductase alpha subunit|nr:nitrate reductase subunit alpha [Aquificota bacterium]